ncbi:CKLF-like MARVEL transmembrane domain containing protein 6 [Dissostichus eleginoides]|uniref:CKLF-like MARVEL transmembrane domain containing protein 6 n=1 Tax=Dissostichus eleginoides TaxID=100907 RepID=A0AAD9C400_DISEL|nr:CKLF-like MARVEL transmembrane domain containing protein 6 [Dissostichus eleginoides]
MTEVYSPTTAPNPKSSCFSVPSDNLDRVRFAFKVLQVLLSLVAFLLEELVSSCLSCSALYFFEFLSCTAFLFTLLLLILLSTPLHSRVGISCWPKLDFVYTAVMALLFLIASIVFAAENGGSKEEMTAVAFGFLATVMFFLDVGYFLKTRSLSFMRDGAPETSNGGVAASAEVEKLNVPE